MWQEGDIELGRLFLTSEWALGTAPTILCFLSKFTFPRFSMTIPQLCFPQTPNTFSVHLTDGLCFYFTAKVDENSPSSRIYEPDPSVFISPLWSQWDGVLPTQAASPPGHQAQSFWKTQRSERSRCGGCPTPSPQPAWRPPQTVL